MPEQILPLSKAEMEIIEAIAEMYSLSVDEVVGKLFSDGLKKRVKGGTGRAPAKVYPIKKK